MTEKISNENPFITIFTPNYNGSKFISETLESILGQTYSNFEYIIIDDHSNDDSWKIIQKYAKKDNRIKIYRNEKNLGITKTRNKGFHLSSTRAKYFAIIDSDDVALFDRIKIQIEFLEKNSDYGLVGSNIIIINEHSKEIGLRVYPLDDTEIRKIITRYNPIAQSSVILRKAVICQVGNYKSQWDVIEDYDYWLRVGLSWKLKNITRPLIKYRLSKTQAKTLRLRETIEKTYKLQYKAVNEYGYKDSFLNKIFRELLKIISIYPIFLYWLYYLRFKKKLYRFTKYFLN